MYVRLIPIRILKIMLCTPSLNNFRTFLLILTRSDIRYFFKYGGPNDKLDLFMYSSATIILCIEEDAVQR